MNDWSTVRRAESIAFAREMISLRNGILRGIPLAEVVEGRATFDVILRGVDGRWTFPVLARVCLAGAPDLVPYAVVTSRCGARRKVYRAGDVCYVPDAAPFQDHDVIDGGSLMAFAGRLLGAHPSTGHWNADGPETGLLDDAATPSLIGARQAYGVKEFEDLGPGPWTSARDAVEATLRSRYAYLDGRFMRTVAEPAWRVLGQDNGKVFVSVEHHLAPCTGSQPVCVAFPMDRRAEALAFAGKVAAAHPRGNLVEVGESVLLGPQCVRRRDTVGPLAAMAVALAVLGAKHLTSVLGDEALDALTELKDAALSHDPSVVRFDRSWDRALNVTRIPEWDAVWDEAFRSTRRALARGEATRDPTTTKWIARIGLMLAAIQALSDARPGDPDLGRRPSSGTEGPSAANHVTADGRDEDPRTEPDSAEGTLGAPAEDEAGRASTAWDCEADALDAVASAVDDMGALLRKGGPAYSSAWRAAMDALGARGRAPPTVATRDALGRLVEATPNGFASADLAVRWAMEWRPTLRACVEGRTLPVAFVPRIASRCRRSLNYGDEARAG